MATAPVTAEFIDKSAWSPGPWQSEVDTLAVADGPTGYALLLNRDAVGGHWLAYVGVPPGHIAYGVADPLRLPVGAMGGLSYAGPLASGDTSRWWTGFSCGAAGALQPLLGTGAVYVTQTQALALAQQLARDLARLAGTAAAGILGLGPVVLPAVPPASPTSPATSTAASAAATASGTAAGVTVTVPVVAVPPVAPILAKL